MRNLKTSIVSLCAASAIALIFAGCSSQSAYQATITPIYAATDQGLWVYNGAAWKAYTAAPSGLLSNNVRSVVVSGSGSGATVLAGTDMGISELRGSSWSSSWTVADGLGSSTINSLYLGSSLIAATAGGVSMYSTDSSSPAWVNNASTGSANCVATYTSYTYIAADTGLYIYNGTVLKTSFPVSAVPQGGTSTRVTSVAVDSNQDLFVGTDQGLFAYSGVSSFSDFGLPSATLVYGLFVDNSGNIFVASSRGLYINPPSAALSNLAAPVYSVYVDGAGAIYAGTGTGLQISKNSGLTWSSTQVSGRVNSIVTTTPLYSF
jgi:ligand-binding sensor domain-containing protein